MHFYYTVIYIIWNITIDTLASLSIGACPRFIPMDQIAIIYAWVESMIHKMKSPTTTRRSSYNYEHDLPPNL